MSLYMQCPGCWSLVEGEAPKGGWLECECGEKLTVIDLRDDGSGDAPLTVDRGNLSHVVRRIQLDGEPETISIAHKVYAPYQPPEEREGQVTVTDEMVDAARRVLDGQQLKWLAVSPAGRKAIARAALEAALDSTTHNPEEGREVKLVINFHEDGDWANATAETFDGGVLAGDSAPIVEGATFDVRSAVIRSAVEKALFEIKAEEDR